MEATVNGKTGTTNSILSSEMKFWCDSVFNKGADVHDIATACEKQCVRCNVSSTKLGRTRS